MKEWQATSHRLMMGHSSASSQRAMIARLLEDSDFLDPMDVDPAEYQIGEGKMGGRRAGEEGGSEWATGSSRGESAPGSADTLSTECCFLSSPEEVPAAEVSARIWPTRKKVGRGDGP